VDPRWGVLDGFRQPLPRGGARPHKVSVDGFWIDHFTVTNRQFAQFVAETGHLTVDELAGKQEEIRAMHRAAATADQ
jgi:formylglycine-generating enzyme required for sulfatase activity